MIFVEKIETYGWGAAVRGMRNPKNSWDRSDSIFYEELEQFTDEGVEYFCIPTLNLGENDIKLMKNLRNAGTDHRKFMRMITVTMDITAPLYWWKEFDTYKVGTVADSCSTMHKIDARDLTFDDFSTEYLDAGEQDQLGRTIEAMNFNRKLFKDTGEKHYWYKMIQLLPTSFNQKRTVQINYEVIANFYKSRKGHKLDEWRDLCTILEEKLPCEWLFTMK